MTILSSDLKFFAAEFPVDTPQGGGRMTATVVQDGTENNLFPDIDAGARAAGRVQLRKVFPAVVSANTDALMGAQVPWAAAPADSAVGVVAFAFGDQGTLRAAAAAVLGTAPYTVAGGLDYTFVSSTQAVLGVLLAPGTPVFFSTYTGVNGQRNYGGLAIVQSVSGYTHTFSGAPVLPLGGASSGSNQAPVVNVRVPAFAAPRCVGPAVATAASTTSGIAVPVEAQIVPAGLASVTGLEVNSLLSSGGKVPIFRVGDGVILRNGGTSEVATVLFVDYRGALTFTAPLANSYPTGSVVCALAQLGDLQASVGPTFSQQTWTRLFSDVLIGNPISANYSRTAGSITTTNLGAATIRWAAVFSSATAFKFHVEGLGQIAAGDTSTDFAPLNPITNTPYLTITAAGWGSGWGIGNVLRGNVIGAQATLWAARTVSPSPIGGLDTGAYLEFRGTINA